MSSLVKEIRTRLSDFLANRLPKGEFDVWFGDLLRTIHAANDPQAEALAYAIEWTFLDRERGLAPELAKSNLEALASHPDHRRAFASRMVAVGGASTRYEGDGTSSTVQVLPGAPVLMGRWQVSLETEYA